ncbi:hypothetical protein STEG23_035837, partial [Scotinomys teguina]
IPTRTFEFFLVLIFTTEEINRNPYLLPNISLMFNIVSGTCFETLNVIDLKSLPKHFYSHFPNYDCGITVCDVHLTGPSWRISIKLTTDIMSPEIFFGPYNPILSDNVLFPNVYQIAHKDACLPKAMVSLMLYFTWTWVPTSTCSLTCTAGFRKFHEEHRADCCFDCAFCPENEVSNETDMEHCMPCQEDQYSNTEHTHCVQRHVSFLAYEDPMGMTLACMSLCFSALTVLILGAFVKYKDTPIVKANNRILSYILLISITFCFLCSFLFIGHPNTVTCILQQTTFGVFFTVAVSTVLAKTITVVLAFKLTTPGERLRGMLVSGAPKFVIPICTVVQLILCGIWMVTSPPFIDTDTHSEHGQIIIVCNKGSVIAFHFVLGYLGSLALGSFTLAFLARNLPDRFNEAKFLTFSMLVFCSVWVTFLPVYQSAKGKVMVAVEVFSILTSTAGLRGCIFLPKCYVIFIRPDSNSLKQFRDKSLC